MGRNIELGTRDGNIVVLHHNDRTSATKVIRSDAQQPVLSIGA